MSNYNTWRKCVFSSVNNVMLLISSVDNICQQAFRSKKLPDHLTPPPPPIDQTISEYTYTCIYL